jgi:hypothetical protein
MRGALRLLLAVGLLATMPAALAAFTSGSNASGSVTAAPDWTGPTATASVIAKQTGYLAGAVKPGGIYYIYANVTDNGNPAAGVSTVRADVNNVTATQTNVTMTAGSYTINGVSYAYRSSSTLTAGAGLTPGSKAFTINSTDALAYPGSQSFSVTVDNSAPSASDIQTTNKVGGTSGMAESGDSITFTYSEQIDPQSILAGWTGASTSVAVHLEDGGCVLNLLVKLCGDDSFEVYNGANPLATLGPVNLKDPDYLGGGLLGGVADAVFTSTMVQSGATITITLGARTGSTPDSGNSTTMEWDSAASPYDAAGNTATGNLRIETGVGDKEF